MTRKKKREKERILKCMNMRLKKEKKTWEEEDEKEGRKAGRKDRLIRDWRAEDLLRVFPPWVEGMAGPVLAVCRLAGSILTLRGEEEQQEVKRLKDTGRLGRQKHTNCEEEEEEEEGGD